MFFETIYNENNIYHLKGRTCPINCEMLKYFIHLQRIVQHSTSYLDNKLKYQELINSFNLKNSCPNGAATIKEETLSFRWCLEPISHEWNFLPNHLFDKAKGPPPRKNFSADEKCDRCGLSFFTSQDSATITFNRLTERIRMLLGYTHVAGGKINTEDGLVSETKNSHYSLFEFEGVNLMKKFEIIDKM